MDLSSRWRYRGQRISPDDFWAGATGTEVVETDEVGIPLGGDEDA